MDERLVEIRKYAGDGYKLLVFFRDWRVAILNYMHGIRLYKNKTMERHMATDEVFAPTRGRGVLLIGGNGPEPEFQ